MDMAEFKRGVIAKIRLARSLGCTYGDMEQMLDGAVDFGVLLTALEGGKLPKRLWHKLDAAMNQVLKEKYEQIENSNQNR